MISPPKRVSDRLRVTISRFQRVLRAARDRDVNESDTVLIVTDMLADVFGFDKYAEITSELAIRGTYCDLAVRIDDVVNYLIEVKAIGLGLKQSHLRQAIDYGANHGVPWVVLTNGLRWEIHRVLFERPIDHELVCEIDFLELRPRNAKDQQKLFLLCREGLAKAAIEKFHKHVQVINRFMVAAIVQSEPSLKLIRRELRRVAPDTKTTITELADLLPEVLKRDVLDGDEAKAAARKLKRAASRTLREATQATVSETGA